MSAEKLPELSFAVEKRAGFLIIDWSLKGGKGCRPANDTELEMLALISALEGDIVDLKGDRDSWEQQAAERLKDWDGMRQRAEAAEQRVRELEADAARYRWLRDQIDTGPLALCEEISSDVHHRWSPIAAYCDEYVDAAIDSARGVEEK